MSKDVLSDRYGRLFEMPTYLAKLGWEVNVNSTIYSRPFVGKSRSVVGGVTWETRGVLRLFLYVLKPAREYGGAVVASSDCFNVILGCWLAKRQNVDFVADLYDNYESFGMAKIPFVLRLYRRALKQASAITCVSEPLAEYVRDQIGCGRGCNTPVVVIESTISAGAFSPRDKHASRAKLSLPPQKRLIGYAGALDASRDINVVYEAFARIETIEPDTVLVLAGAVDGSCPVPMGPNVIYLGALAHEDVADFYGALDVGVICLKDSEFGRYAFPQKAFEMISMRIPLAVTNVGAMGRLFDGFPALLYSPGDADDLTRVLLRQLASPVLVDMPIPTWEDQAKKMKSVLEGVMSKGSVSDTFS
jgi:glycosyltransferase involved in cell wall biosynthesis